ncbi:cytochrome P450 [Marasmius fiardii PR-910]|nr:cytochrome P450 [Marasmius fiardii PR-910]
MDQIKSLFILPISSLILAFLIKHYHRGSQLPPGPKGLPIIGNIFDLQKLHKPSEKPWSHLYGDIFTFHVLGSRTVVLNSYKAIMDLLGHRSQDYSDRPRMYHALCKTIDVVLWGWMFPLMGYSENWRLHRKAFHEYFQPRVVPQYYEIQRERASLLMQDLVTSPKDFFEHVGRFPGAIILEIVYGFRSQDSLDSYVELAARAMARFNDIRVGKYLVDYFPILKYIPDWFPAADFKRKAKIWAQDAEQMRDVPWKMVKNLMDEGTAVSCFCTENLEKLGSLSTSSNVLTMEEMIRNCAGVTFIGGADTTGSTILSFILAMVLYPEVQARSQKELDKVIGLTRLPDFSDREDLPYINATLSELLRWNPVTPLGFPHRAMKDDTYDGYLIPGGNVSTLCLLAVFQDESLYGPETTKFNPERFMKQDGKSLPPNPETLAFGFGRRLCPARHLAINSLWLAMTYLLANFTMVKEVDDDGNEIDPVVDYLVGVSSRPCPFNCRFVPRPSAPAFI